MTVHFSYGSNMSVALMRLHAPGARAIGTGRLDAHRFIVTSDGYASVVPASGQAVHGVLWWVTPREVAALDDYESTATGLYRRVRMRVSSRGRREAAILYLARTRATGQPRSGYLDVVLAAAHDWRLPPQHIRAIERWSPTAWRGARLAN